MPRREIEDYTANHAIRIVVGPASPDPCRAAHFERKVEQAVIEVFDPRSSASRPR